MTTPGGIAAAWSGLPDPKKPFTIDLAGNSLVNPPALGGDLGAGYLQPAPVAIDLFTGSGTKGGPGGGGGGTGGGGGGPTTITYGLSGSLQFQVTYDSSVTGASNAAAIEGGFAAAIGYFTQTFHNPITIKLSVGWGEVGGAALPTNALGASITAYAGVSYSSLIGQMKNEAHQSSDQLAAYSTLPSSSPVAGANYYIAAAEAKALNFRLLGKTGTDGYVGFGNSYSWDFTHSGNTSSFDFVGVAEHEISEAMGRTSLLGSSSPGMTNGYTAMDLFRFSDINLRSTQPGGTAYLSFDNGATNLSNFHTDPTTGDVGDWAGTGTAQSNDAYNYAGGQGLLPLSTADLKVMNVLGYTLA